LLPHSLTSAMWKNGSSQAMKKLHSIQILLVGLLMHMSIIHLLTALVTCYLLMSKVQFFYLFEIVLTNTCTLGIVYQDGTLCLFDPQAHTCVDLPTQCSVYPLTLLPIRHTGASGHWDKGHDKIDAYQHNHKCNSICCLLGLHKEMIYSDTTGAVADPGSRAHPLHVGFE